MQKLKVKTTSAAKDYQHSNRKGDCRIMTREKKRGYESASVEVLLIEENDVITTSGFSDNTEYVDPDENAWVSIGNGGWN